METTAKKIKAVNNIIIHRIRAKIFKPKDPRGALLTEFTDPKKANKLIQAGVLWNYGFYECEAYSGDL